MNSGSCSQISSSCNCPILCLSWIVTRSWTILCDQRQPAIILFNYEFQAHNPDYHYKKRTLVFPAFHTPLIKHNIIILHTGCQRAILTQSHGTQDLFSLFFARHT